MQENSFSFPIKHWSDEDRPREKLRSKGRSVLTNAELMAILIGSGTRHESAVQLSKRILGTTGDSLSELGKLSVEQLMKFKGIGEAKAITIVAAMELGRRQSASAVRKKKTVKNSKQVFEFLHPTLGDLPHEEFWILFLNNSNRILHSEQMSKGGINGTLVDIRLIMKKALNLGAVALILAHNHPSGVLVPSQSDKDLTKKLIRGAEALDIKILDHLIISHKSYFSFSDNQLI